MATSLISLLKRSYIVDLMSGQQQLDLVSCFGQNEMCRTPHIYLRNV